MADLRAMIGAAKAGSGAFSTNFLLTDAAIEPAVRAGNVFALASDGAVVLLRRDPLFDRLYYAAADASRLAVALSRLELPPSGALVTDLIGRREEVTPWMTQFEEAGFSSRATILRMQRLLSEAPPVENRDPEVEVAEERDAEDVRAVIANGFDEFVDQIPSIAEIRRAASLGTILLVRDSGRIAGLLFYDRVGQTTVCRYWVVRPEYQGRGRDVKLMRRYWQDCRECRRFMLWVRQSNSHALLIYKWYGYKLDSIIDVVMIKRRFAIM